MYVTIIYIYICRDRRSCSYKKYAVPHMFRQIHSCCRSLFLYVALQFLFVVVCFCLSLLRSLFCFFVEVFISLCVCVCFAFVVCFFLSFFLSLFHIDVHAGTHAYKHTDTLAGTLRQTLQHATAASLRT